MPVCPTSHPVLACLQRPTALGVTVLWVSAASAASPAVPPAPAAAEWRYPVAAGDTLYDIARTHLAPGIGWQRLQRLNRVPAARRLPVGRELRIPVAWLRSTAAVATVAFVSGRAFRQPADAAAGAPGEPLQAGDTLATGDVLITDADAGVTLRLADSTRVLVSAGARLRMDSLLTRGPSGIVDSRLELQRGETDTRVNPQHLPGSRYDLRTPVLTLGVRGTEFRARVDEAAGTTQAEVTEGRVDVTAASAPGRTARRAVPPTRSLDAGFGVTAAAGGPLGEDRPLPPAPLLAAAPTRLERLPIRFDWPALEDAAAYRAQVFRDEAAPAAEGASAPAADLRQARLLDGVFARPAASWPDLADGRYRLVVRARDAQGIEGREAALAFVLKARPEPPFLMAPRDGDIARGERVTLSWTRNAAAQRYRLQLAAGDGGFESPQIDRDDVDARELGLTLPPGRYRWRLASIAAGNDLGPFSDASAFELRATPPPPELQPPQAQGDALVFRWRAGAAGAHYDVQLADEPSFAAPLVERRVDGPELALTPPAPGRYHLRVRSVDGDGYAGPFGAAQQFEVARKPWWLLLIPVLWLLL